MYFNPVNISEHVCVCQIVSQYSWFCFSGTCCSVDSYCLGSLIIVCWYFVSALVGINICVDCFVLISCFTCCRFNIILTF